jgi:very-short-patch-repair endonuclease
MRAPILTVKRARALRRRMTLPEVLLWQALRGGRAAGLRFRRQHPIGPYILDFFCPSARLAVEVDGATHDIAKQARRDERRDAWLAARNIRVLHVTAAEVLKADGMESVLLAIEQAAAPSTACGGPPPPLCG